MSKLSRAWIINGITILSVHPCFTMITKEENKQSRNAPYLQNCKDTKCLQFKMAVSVLPVPLLTSHTTNTVNHKIVKAMEKEDPGPTKFIAYPKEKVNLYFIILTNRGGSFKFKKQGVKVESVTIFFSKVTML